MVTLLHDLRYGLRLLYKSPGFTAVALFSLALGIGVNSAIFSIVNAVLIQPLPVKNPHQLVALYTSQFDGGLYGTSSYADYLDFRDKTSVFSDVIADFGTPFSISEGELTERVQGAIVTGNYFTALGVAAERGRVFTSEEDKSPGANPVAVISHALWQRRFRREPNIIGKNIVLNGNNFNVIGVAREDFTGTTLGIPVDIWVPTMMYAQLGIDAGMINGRGNNWLSVMARLKPDVSLEQAQSSLNILAHQLKEQYPANWGNQRNQPRAITLYPQSTARIPPQVHGVALGLSGFLMVMVLLVLLIACANVSTLLIARASARYKEIGIRLALGATRWRLIRQLLTESMLLCIMGGLIGMLLAFWASHLLMAFKLPPNIPITLSFQADYRVFAFTLGLSLLTGFIFGVAPALYAVKAELVPALSDKPLSIGRGYRQFGFRNLLVIAQVAMSMVMLINAGLFIRSLQSAKNTDLGFKSAQLLTLTPDMTVLELDMLQAGRAAKNNEKNEKAVVDQSRIKQFYSDLLARLQGMPGIQSATLASEIPLSLSDNRREISIDGHVPRSGEDMVLNYNLVGPNYFRTMAIPLTSGRDFTDQDREGAQGVAIVNERMAQRFWPGQNPLGKQLSLEVGRADAPRLVVVGVAKDIKYLSLGEEPTPYLYLSALQNFNSGLKLHVRTAGDPRPVVANVRNVILELNKNVPVSNVLVEDDHLGIVLLLPRVGASILGVFGFLAMMLAGIGLYGVISYSVVRRTREIGIRMALGAQRRDVLRLIVMEGMVLVGIGIVLGVIIAGIGTRVLSGLLYGIDATDLTTFVSTALLLAVVALIATYVPAREATRIEPLRAIRYE